MHRGSLYLDEAPVYHAHSVIWYYNATAGTVAVRTAWCGRPNRTSNTGALLGTIVYYSGVQWEGRALVPYTIIVLL